MADTRMTLEEIEARPSTMDRARIAATTEEDVRRQQLEDGEEPDATVDPRAWQPNVASLRRRLRLTQADFALAIRVPVATVRNWEQHRFEPDPAARSLLWILDREPEMALRALGAAAAASG